MQYPHLEPKDIYARTAALWSPGKNEATGCSGTAFYLGQNILLTAHHVCASDIVHYRWEGQDIWREDGRVIERDEKLDVAVVRVQTREIISHQGVSAWLYRPGVRAETTVMGYPAFQRGNQRLELEHIQADCEPFTGTKEGTFKVLTAKNHPSGAPKSWKGVSGAGLIIHGALAGIVIEARPNGLVARTLESLLKAHSPVWPHIEPHLSQRAPFSKTRNRVPWVVVAIVGCLLVGGFIFKSKIGPIIRQHVEGDGNRQSIKNAKEFGKVDQDIKGNDNQQSVE